MPTLFFIASACRRRIHSSTPSNPAKRWVRPSNNARASSSARSRLNFAVANAAEVATIFRTS